MLASPEGLANEGRVIPKLAVPSAGLLFSGPGEGALDEPKSMYAEDAVYCMSK